MLTIPQKDVDNQSVTDAANDENCDVNDGQQEMR